MKPSDLFGLVLRSTDIFILSLLLGCPGTEVGWINGDHRINGLVITILING